MTDGTLTFFIPMPDNPFAPGNNAARWHDALERFADTAVGLHSPSHARAPRGTLPPAAPDAQRILAEAVARVEQAPRSCSADWRTVAHHAAAHGS